jgi:glycogen(starch) synthase
MGDRSPGVDLVIAGQGPALEDLRRRAVSLGVEARVRFPGRLSREEVAAAIAGATVFVMPSRLEPFGIVILEAWRGGVAVVASNRGGAPEFVDSGRNGVLVDPFDTGGLAAVLEDLLADDVRRRSLAEAGHRRVEAFSWSAIAGAYREVYSAVLGGARDGGAPDDRAIDRADEPVR